MNLVIQFSVILLLFYPISAENGYVYNADLRISYKYHSIPLNWLDAKTICAEEDARLALPKTKSEAQAIAKLYNDNYVSGLNNYTYLDIHEYFGENDFVSRDIHLQYFFHTWGSDQPQHRSYEKCVILYTPAVQLHDSICTDLNRFICQKEDSSKIESWEKSIRSSKIIEDPAYKYEPISGKYFKLHMTPSTWNVSRAICNAEGGQLAIIRSKHEENFLVEMFNDPENLWPGARSHAHIGFHDLYKFREFYTVTDEKLDNIGYMNWAPGEPNNNYNNERCGSMAKSGGLNDFDCSYRAQFFCEIKSRF